MCHLFIFSDHSFNNTESQPEKSYTVCFVAASWVFIDGRSYENLDRGESVSVTVRVWAEYKSIERERERMSGDSWKHWNNSRTYELFSQTKKGSLFAYRWVIRTFSTTTSCSSCTFIIINFFFPWILMFFPLHLAVIGMALCQLLSM